MTRAQEKFYWRLWGQVVHANDWRLVKGRWQCDFAAQRKLSTHHDHVCSLARARAEQQHRAPTADDLRHAGHIIAAGRDVSHPDLTAPQFDKLVALWKLLIEPTDLDAALALSDPDIGARKRLVWRIGKAAPHAYIDRICRDRFGDDYSAPFWEDLPVNCLKILAHTLRERTRDWQQPVGVQASACPPVGVQTSACAEDPY